MATVALETVHRSDLLQEAADEALRSWVDLVAERLVALGVAAESAAEIASVTIAILEGAELMARVHKSRSPLEAAANRLPLLVEPLPIEEEMT